MTRLVRTISATAGSVAVITFASCFGGPGRITQPGIDASSAGSGAMELYDTNGDGNVAGDELEKAPSLKAALQNLDKNGDNGVNADEVAERVRAWQHAGIGLMSFGFTVTLDGSPLPDAVVTFEPEAFLGDEIHSASATTNQLGGSSATIPKDERPDPSYPPGMHLGLYKVKISKIVNGKETIPKKYNEATVFGQEVAQDVSEIANKRVVFAVETQ